MDPNRYSNIPSNGSDNPIDEELYSFPDTDPIAAWFEDFFFATSPQNYASSGYGDNSSANGYTQAAYTGSSTGNYTASDLHTARNSSVENTVGEAGNQRNFTLVNQRLPGQIAGPRFPTPQTQRSKAYQQDENDRNWFQPSFPQHEIPGIGQQRSTFMTPPGPISSSFPADDFTSFNQGVVRDQNSLFLPEHPTQRGLITPDQTPPRPLTKRGRGRPRKNESEKGKGKGKSPLRPIAASAPYQTGAAVPYQQYPSPWSATLPAANQGLVQPAPVGNNAGADDRFYPRLPPEAYVLRPSKAKADSKGDVLDAHGRPAPAPYTKKPFRKLDFLPDRLDYSKIDGEFLLRAEAQGASINGDIIPRIDPNTLSDGLKKRWDDEYAIPAPKKPTKGETSKQARAKTAVPSTDQTGEDLDEKDGKAESAEPKKRSDAAGERLNRCLSNSKQKYRHAKNLGFAPGASLLKKKEPTTEEMGVSAVKESGVPTAEATKVATPEAVKVPTEEARRVLGSKKLTVENLIFNTIGEVDLQRKTFRIWYDELSFDDFPLGEPRKVPKDERKVLETANPTLLAALDTRTNSGPSSSNPNAQVNPSRKRSRSEVEEDGRPTKKPWRVEGEDVRQGAQSQELTSNLPFEPAELARNCQAYAGGGQVLAAAPPIEVQNLGHGRLLATLSWLIQYVPNAQEGRQSGEASGFQDETSQGS